MRLRPTTPEDDTLTAQAAELAADLSLQSRRARPVRGPAQLLRGLERLRRGVLRQLRAVLREHWDVGAFDLVFGSLKAFGVYPALYFAGLAWTIPLMEYAPLNTQLWTAGYLVARRRLLSHLGRRRYGASLDELDELRDRLSGAPGDDARAVHRFSWNGQAREVRIRRSGWRAVWSRLRGQPTAPGVVRPAELRRWIRDPEFRYRVGALAHNPGLYERVLIERLLATPGEREALLARCTRETPRPETAQAFLDADPIVARAEAERDRLHALLSGANTSAGRGLGWLASSHVRALRGLLTGLRHREYRLLADVRDGSSVEGSPRLADVERRRARIGSRLGRLVALVDAVEQAPSPRALHGILRLGVVEAHRMGVRARRARLALAFSASDRPRTATTHAEGVAS